MKTINKIYTGLLAGSIAIAFSSCLKDYDNPSAGVVANKTYLHVLRDSYHGSELTLGPDNLAGATLIHGVVITDRSGLNTDPSIFVIQETAETGNQVGDITRGVQVKMTSGNAEFDLGDSLAINVNGAKLGRIDGKLTITGITADKITKIAEDREPLARQVTLAMMNAMMGQFESTLVAVHADVDDYGPVVTFSGERTLNDHTGAIFYLQTNPTAGFAGTTVPMNAQFTGIAGYDNPGKTDTIGAKKTIRLRNAGDIMYESGQLYEGFPESFESPDITAKSSYNSGTNRVDLSTGNWTLLQAILANTVIRDKYNLPGKQSIRMQQNLASSGYVQMNFDVPDGASKVTIFAGKYYTDPSSTFRLEYSINGGTNWIVVGANVSNMPERGSKQATFIMNITVPVRFRINKLGLGASTATIFNGRLGLDDFAIYKNL